MIEITNLTKGPVKLLLRSRLRSNGGRQMTEMTLPGIGNGKNVVLIEDERWTPTIDKLAKSQPPMIRVRKGVRAPVSGKP